MYKLYKNIDLALTLNKAFAKKGRHIKESDLSIVKNPLMLTGRNKILWLGSKKKFNAQVLKKFNIARAKLKEIDLQGRQIMPSFSECHTHSVFAGDRQDEFELRNKGASYQQIANKGGGIKSTVKHTRIAKPGKLEQLLIKRVKIFKDQGVSLLEIKSGYGLNYKTEEKLLKIIKNIKSMNVVATFLGPHACPNEFTSSEDYMDYIISNMLPKLIEKKLIDRADIFIEKKYFNTELAKKYFDFLEDKNISLTCHLDQLSNSRAVKTLSQYKNIHSLDHLVCIDKAGIRSLAQSDVTGVLLPLADFYLKMNYPPARELIDSGARVALATDFNPGSAPSQDLSLVGVLARLEMKMSLAEVICAYTLNAAYALGYGQRLGSLTPGKQAHFVTLADDYDKLFYQVGHHPIKKLYSNKL